MAICSGSHKSTRVDVYALALMSLLVITGASSLATFADGRKSQDRRALGLYLGLVLIFISSVLLYGTTAADLFGKYEFVAYMLGLTRSSPLLMGMAAVFFAVAVEKKLTPEPKADPAPFFSTATWIATLVSGGLLILVNMRHNAWMHGALALSLVTIIAYRWRSAVRVVGAAWMAAGGMAALAFVAMVSLEAMPEVYDKQLFEWVRDSTPQSVSVYYTARF